MKTYLPFVFALGTALCWGLYGPILGKARIADADLSPFKPYVMIGVAYLVIAIVGGSAGMVVKGDTFNMTGAGALWGLVAGILGAAGAFNLTMSMFTGGARIPHSVMPVVFGGAVTVTALFTVLSSKGTIKGGPMLWFGIVLMLVSVVIITQNTPHPTPSGASHGEEQHAEEAGPSSEDVPAAAGSRSASPGSEGAG